MTLEKEVVECMMRYEYNQNWKECYSCDGYDYICFKYLPNADGKPTKMIPIKIRQTVLERLKELYVKLTVKKGD